MVVVSSSTLQAQPVWMRLRMIHNWSDVLHRSIPTVWRRHPGPHVRGVSLLLRSTPPCLMLVVCLSYVPSLSTTFIPSMLSHTLPYAPPYYSLLFPTIPCYLHCSILVYSTLLYHSTLLYLLCLLCLLYPYSILTLPTTLLHSDRGIYPRPLDPLVACKNILAGDRLILFLLVTPQLLQAGANM